MKRTIKVGKKLLPAWLLILTLILTGAGAAVGTALAPEIGGEIPVTVSQALTIGDQNSLVLPSGAPGILTVSDDGTGFTAAAEIHNGDLLRVKLEIENKSSQEITAKLRFSDLPEGITLDVNELAGGDIIGSAVRTGMYEWLFRLNPDANDAPDLEIIVALADAMTPGFYKIRGEIEPVTS